MAANLSSKELTGTHVLALLLGFLALVLLANGIFIYFALTSFSGLETEQPYREGLAYNRLLEQAEAQHARGWSVALEPGPDGDSLRAHYFDRHQTALEGLVVSLRLRHPTRASLDRAVMLSAKGGGLYEARLQTPAPGQWRGELEARRGGILLHRQETRLWLK